MKKLMFGQFVIKIDIIHAAICVFTQLAIAAIKIIHSKWRKTNSH
jgi:hypothetical protein